MPRWNFFLHLGKKNNKKVIAVGNLETAHIILHQTIFSHRFYYNLNILWYKMFLLMLEMTGLVFSVWLHGCHCQCHLSQMFQKLEFIADIDAPASRARV